MIPRLGLLTVALLWCPLAAGQPVTASFSDETASHGEIVTVTTEMIHPDMDGWSFGSCHDPSELDLVSVEDGLALVLDPPAFNTVNLFDGGWTAGVVFFGPGAFFPAATSEIKLATYEVISTEPDHLSSIEFCDTLGSPPVSIQFIPEGLGAPTTFLQTNDGSVLINPLIFFRRGDANLDGLTDLADALTILDGLFLDLDLTCPSAADVDDSGALDLADPIQLLTALFGTGYAIPGPTIDCGVDPTRDSLSCPPATCP